MQDISERKRSETDIWNAAHYDTLTGLPNRMYLVEVLDDDARSGDRPRGRPSALLLLDVDNFKVVNDTLGHEAGDLMLRKAAERLHRVRTSNVISSPATAATSSLCCCATMAAKETSCVSPAGSCARSGGG